MESQKWVKGRVAVCVGAILSSHTAFAATYSVTGSTADAEVNSANVGDGGGSVSNATKNGTLLPGAFNLTIISPVFVFQLPTLAPGETITTANLDLRTLRAGTISFNADLYGLGFRSASTVLGTDYFSGTLDATDATLIQDNLFTPAVSTTASTIGTSATGDTALASYLQAQYAAGATGGSFVFLRLSPDFTTNPGTATSASLGYATSSAETTSKPLLTVTTTPEPTGAGTLAALGVAALTARRRRNR
jgi:MYXO-CTERM domain-containing protein